MTTATDRRTWQFSAPKTIGRRDGVWQELRLNGDGCIRASDIRECDLLPRGDDSGYRYLDIDTERPIHGAVLMRGKVHGVSEEVAAELRETEWARHLCEVVPPEPEVEHTYPVAPGPDARIAELEARLAALEARAS